MNVVTTQYNAAPINPDEFPVIYMSNVLSVWDGGQFYTIDLNDDQPDEPVIVEAPK